MLSRINIVTTHQDLPFFDNIFSSQFSASKFSVSAVVVVVEWTAAPMQITGGEP